MKFFKLNRFGFKLRKEELPVLMKLRKAKTMSEIRREFEEFRALLKGEGLRLKPWNKKQAERIVKKSKPLIDEPFKSDRAFIDEYNKSIKNIYGRVKRWRYREKKKNAFIYTLKMFRKTVILKALIEKTIAKSNFSDKNLLTGLIDLNEIIGWRGGFLAKKINEF